MAREDFRIHLERLREGQQIAIEENFSPDFLDVHEKELAFQKPVSINGEAYLAGDALILHLKLLTFATIPCSICNEPVDVKISIDNFYHAEPIENVKGGVFDYREALREAVLLEIPAFVECQGKCPSRKEIKKYLTKPGKSKEDGSYHPFADL